MILSYKQKFPWGKPTHFEQKIKDGIKIHTFREDPHDRWKAGRHIHHANGVRTKKYNCFQEDDCVSVQSIQIQYQFFHGLAADVKIIINGDLKYHQDGLHVTGSDFLEELAKNDGFDSVEDFFRWFSSDFQGVIIHWTDFRY